MGTGGLERRIGGGLDGNAIAAGVGASLAASIIAAAVIAVLVSFTSITETYFSIVLYSGGLLILAIGAAIGARRADRMGWVHGGLTGLASMAVAMFLIAVFYPDTLSLAEILRQGALAFLIGSIGGILGINL